MSRTSHRAVSTLSLVCRLAVPALAVSTGTLVPGCLFGSPGPSSVATGKLYVSGEPSYDQFFSELYQVQLPMGQAADREAGNRARVSNALGIPQTSTADQIADALDQRAMHVTKAGVTVKVATSGLDDATATPSASLVTAGSGADANDTVLLNALAESIRDAAALISDVRRMRPSIDRLKPQADSLEPGIDQTFRKGGSPKKGEVRKNVVDAQRMIPLMSLRADDIAHLSTDFIRKVQKVLGSAEATAAPAPAPAPAAAAAPAAAPAPAPKKGGKAKGGAAPSHAEPSDEEPKAAPEPKAKPPADDFEP